MFQVCAFYMGLSSAQFAILFYADGRGLLAISAAIRVPGLSFASTKGKPAPVLIVHGKVTSIAALMASTCVRKPKHRRQARSPPNVLELSISHGLSPTDIYSHCSEPVELLAWNISGVLVAT